MNISIFWICVMECMCAQARPQFMLSSERVWGYWSQNPWKNPREKSPLPQVLRRAEPTMLHHAGQWAQHTTDWAFLAPCDTLNRHFTTGSSRQPVLARNGALKEKNVSRWSADIYNLNGEVEEHESIINVPVHSFLSAYCSYSFLSKSSIHDVQYWSLNPL